ncbi:hypothetical protein Atai01_81950 [Amycolatopsis taiwanensis]|uniref:Transposase IS701-like DDE domain-containing protein n=1 Tax=Amycolatopsis taiwanensis TaxID=342230 RepID=A0A9W6R915_9PSEU|nr:hypothetical protein Atai01_81950 [Amycolatopsis taiwanensis]
MAGLSINPARWQAMFSELTGRIAVRFSWVEPRRRAEKLLLRLVAVLPRKNCWTIAEHVADATPDGLQHLLARDVWDADAVRDDLRGYVRDHLGSQDAVLIVDETGDVKKGSHTVGVQRQYTGTSGRIKNSQVAVYLTYATTRGHTFIDRAPYLPESWTSDRCAAAGLVTSIRHGVMVLPEKRTGARPLTMTSTTDTAPAARLMGSVGRPATVGVARSIRRRAASAPRPTNSRRSGRPTADGRASTVDTVDSCSGNVQPVVPGHVIRGPYVS